MSDRRTNGMVFDNLPSQRTPPMSIEAEQGLLGCLIMAPGPVHTEIGAHMRPEFFYDLRHQGIYESIAGLLDKGKPVDLICLQEHLKDRNQLEAVGGITYLSALPDCIPTHHMALHYVRVLRDKWVLREMIRVGTETVNAAFSNRPPIEICESAGQSVSRLSLAMLGESEQSMKELVNGSITRFEEWFENKGKLVGLPTGLLDLDEITGGLKNGNMIVLAARPSCGKTSLLMNIVDHVAVEHRLPVGVFSLEMSAAELTDRMISSRARINLDDIRLGRLGERDFHRMTEAASKIADSPITIDDTGGLTLNQLRARARKMKQKGIRMLGVDYLQLISAPGKGRYEQMTVISNGIKSMAKELNIPVVVLSQLNRDLEKDKDRKPRMSDLRETGAIEQDADVVGMLYKPPGNDSESFIRPVNLLIGKQRNGRTGTVYLTFFGQFTRFESAPKTAEVPTPYKD